MTLPYSEYFSLEELADGVFAAIATPYSAVFSNAGIIDTGSHTLIFDTFNSHLAAENLSAISKKLTGRSGDFVINSHAHADHWKGNQVFASHANIVSTPAIHDIMKEWVNDFREMKRNPGDYREYLENTREILAKTKDPRLQNHIEWSLVIQQHEYENLRAIRPTLPEQIFEHEICFHGDQRSVRVTSFGVGHTQDDVVLTIDADALAFIGDLGFFNTHPYLGSSVPEKWLETLDNLIDSPWETFVPGHGPLGTKTNLADLKKYILACQQSVRAVIAEDGDERDAIRKGPPQFADDWAGFGRFERSIRFLFQHEMRAKTA